MLATTTSALDPSMSVLRVSRESENIGERVARSKKRVTWRFVFADSAQVHTVMLEHSRVTAKKRLRLDGRRLFASDHFFAGGWSHHFHVPAKEDVTLCVAIRHVASTVVVGERRLESVYDLSVDGVHWDQLPERSLGALAMQRQRGAGGLMWSSELYARRVSMEQRVLERAVRPDVVDHGSVDDGSIGPPVDRRARQERAQCTSWTFAFGLHGTLHKMELRDVDRGDDTGEFVVILDSRLLCRMNHDDIDEDVWEYEYALSRVHTLGLIVTLEEEGKRYEFFVNGCAWKDLSETEFVLQSGWFPVYSRSRGTSYFRNENHDSAQWERPIVSRTGEPIDVPRRASTQHEPLPTDRFDADGLRISSGQERSNSVESNNQTASVMAQQEQQQQLDYAHYNYDQSVIHGKETADEINLLDFSEMTIRVSPRAEQQDSTLVAFDPFAHIAQPSTQQKMQQPHQQRREQPIDLLA